MKKINLSVVIITLNEADNLPKCLLSVKDIADEIIVVDSGSQDKTIEIAKKYGAIISFRKFDNFANQKNYALGQAHGEWIFSIDADEKVTHSLAAEIQKKTKDTDISGFLIPRRNIIFGAEIKHTRWSPDRHIWLFRKGKGKWVGKIHEEIVVDGKVGSFKNAKIHYSHKNVSEFVSMVNKYTELEAEERTELGIKFSFLRLLVDPVISFFGRYFYKLGFLDGWRGFLLAYLRAFYKFVIWAKVWEMKSRA